MLLQPHQIHWANNFAAISKVIRTALPGASITIEHIGSTAVKDLAAKPIIDIDLVFHSPAGFDSVKAGLESLGYYHNGDQGIKNREVFKRKETKEKHPILDTIHHHLYVCPAHSEELRRHLRFRDYLQANEEARRQYERIKYAIAEQANQDRKSYAKLKEEQASEIIAAMSE